MAKLNRRTFLMGTAAGVGAAAVGAGVYWVGSQSRVSRAGGKKVIVVGIDGMDPVLSERLMNSGQMPNLARLREVGGFSPLGTSIPPQSPVAWANFINGSGPGSHGIFDFIHRHPHEQCRPFSSMAETVNGSTVLRRQGEPFWDFLDAAGIPSTFYDLPSNYPPSKSQHGYCRCISGMGTPDMMGTYGTYQYFAESPPPEPREKGGEKLSVLSFEREKATARLFGPETGDGQLSVECHVHRDRQANAAVIEMGGRKILLKAGQWSPWTKLTFELPWYEFANVTGIVRFYLQEVSPNFRLYVSPVNMDPSAPAKQMSEPDSFVKDVSKSLGLFGTAGFQEDYSARKNGVFTDDEFLKQAGLVLEERLALFDHAVNNYDDGLLFFYFSSSDLQSHMFWWEWDPNGPTFHPSREDAAVWKNADRVRTLYKRLDQVVGDLVDRYGSVATIFVMSDHGFSNFGRQFNLNSWLRDFGYLGPAGCTSIMTDVDWSVTYAYGLGINGLYLNLKGRERDGIVEPGKEAEEKLAELKERLEAEVDPATGVQAIRNVYRSDQIYSGGATALAPDLIVGYRRGYRASWETCLGDLSPDIWSDNKLAWSADHCADALEVPGVLWCNRPFRAKNPALVDVAPSILAEFGLPTPSSMSGKSIFW